MELIVGILLILAAIVLVVFVMLQESKSDRLSGAVTGSGDTYWSKGKGKSKEAFYNKITLIVSICFIVIALVLYVTHPWSWRSGDVDDVDATTTAAVTTSAPATTEAAVTTGTVVTTGAAVTTSAVTE